MSDVKESGWKARLLIFAFIGLLLFIALILYIYNYNFVMEFPVQEHEIPRN